MTKKFLKSLSLNCEVSITPPFPYGTENKNGAGFREVAGSRPQEGENNPKTSKIYRWFIFTKLHFLYTPI